MALSPLQGKTQSFGITFARIANLAARPTFELKFNIFQNAQIDRINKEIVRLQEENKFTSSTDTVLTSRQRSLERQLTEVSAYEKLQETNFRRIGIAIKQFDAMTAAAANTVDPNAPTAAEQLVFDEAKSSFLSAVKAMKGTQFTLIGMPDNIRKVQRSMLDPVTFPQTYNDTSGAGPVQTELSDISSTPQAFTDYTLDDVATKLTDFNQYRFSVLANVADTSGLRAKIRLNQEVAEAKRVSIERQLEEVKNKLKQQKDEREIDQFNQVQALRQQAAVVLNIASVAFEGQQFMVEELGKRLANNQTPEAGSVLNLFV